MTWTKKRDILFLSLDVGIFEYKNQARTENHHISIS